MRTLVPVLLAALVVATPGAAAIEREFTVYLHEKPLHILPETIQANVGDVLKLTVENPEAPGKTVHNLRVCGDGKKFSEACDEPWGFTGMIQPGQSAQLSVEVKRAGVFEYYCYIAGHKGGGMVGELHVADAGTAPKETPVPAWAALLAALAAVALARRRSA